MLMTLTGLEKEWAQTAPNSFVGRETVSGDKTQLHITKPRYPKAKTNLFIGSSFESYVSTKTGFWLRTVG